MESTSSSTEPFLDAARFLKETATMGALHFIWSFQSYPPVQTFNCGYIAVVLQLKVP